MLPARDYYYQVVAPGEDYKSYQYNHHRSDRKNNANFPNSYAASDEEIQRMASHIPTRSNDFLIETYLEELLSVAPDEFRSRLAKIFVAKLYDFEANAAALHNRDSYDGDLIFFNVGLSDACFQYSILYYEFIRLINERIRKGEKHPEIQFLVKAVNEHIIKLVISQNRWNRTQVVCLTPDDVIHSKSDIEQKAATIATYADKFILYHEIAHHMLGHTNQNVFTFLSTLPKKCKGWDSVDNDSYKHEYQADAGALLLTLRMRSSNIAAERDKELKIIIGCLFTLTVIGQFVKDIHSYSLTHPSVSSRFDYATNILLELCIHENSINQIIDDIKRFQWILFRSQNRGLGGRWNLSDFK